MSTPQAVQRADWTARPHWVRLSWGSQALSHAMQCWQDWLQDQARPRVLHLVVMLPALPDWQSALDQAAQHWPVLGAVLRHRAQGLLPGFHRLMFEQGQVLFTLCLGPVEASLKELDVPVDEALGPTTRLDTRAVTRLCRPGTCWWPQSSASESPPPGFMPHGPEAWVYAPHWRPRTRLRGAAMPEALPEGTPPHALVVGAGLAGAAVAASLALRGWQVQVLDAGEDLGAGASGLPAGLTVPHVSPDDNTLSRLTRAGVRATLQRADTWLQDGIHWGHTGVLEHRVEGKRGLPAAWPEAGQAWSTPASPNQLAQAGLPPDTPALWHAMAAWLRPRELVAAALRQPGVTWRTGHTVAHLQRDPAGWTALDAQGQPLAQAPVVVLAAGYAVRALLSKTTHEGLLPLNPLRGQISWGLQNALPADVREKLPPFPVNGLGSFISGVSAAPLAADDRPAWFVGSTFERNTDLASLKTEDHSANLARLQRLLPGLGSALDTQVHTAQGWAGLRCTLPDRLPVVGLVDNACWPGLAVCTGMGARGVSLSVLCGEVLAAGLMAEPWPVETRLAQALAASRFVRPPTEDSIP